MRPPRSKLSAVSRRATRALRNPATAVAVVALLISLTGSATAAILLTGKNIKDGTLTGADLKAGTLTKADFGATDWAQQRGWKGQSGGWGPSGDKGATGPQGPIGPQGNAAHVASKWAWWESRSMNAGATNTGPTDWQSYNYDGHTGYQSPSSNGNLDPHNQQFDIQLGLADTNVMDLDSPNCPVGTTPGSFCPFGANDGGGVTVSWSSNITAVATVNIVHSQDADLAAPNRLPHTRASCYLAANNGNGNSGFEQIGAKSTVSAFRQRQVETLTLVGSINRDLYTSTPTTYLVRVMCRDSDATGSHIRYWVTGGSMSVIATERGNA